MVTALQLARVAEVMWDLLDDTVCDTCPEQAHTSAMNTYRLWMETRISMASSLVLDLSEALMVWPEGCQSDLSEKFMQQRHE